MSPRPDALPTSFLDRAQSLPPMARRTSRQLPSQSLEIIEVEDPGPEAAELDPKDRLFVSAHWAAAHAWIDRRDGRAEKRGSDGLDIIELLRRADWMELGADAHLSDSVRTALAWAADAVLVHQAERVTRMIQLHTNAVPPEPAEVRALALLRLERL
jgi:hypothetical protein